jgi:hypothetical protein
MSSFACRDEFGKILAAVIPAQPPKESLTRTVEEAVTSFITAAANPASLAVDRLIRNTPALRERDYVKYARLVQTLAGALMGRERSDRGRFRADATAGSYRHRRNSDRERSMVQGGQNRFIECPRIYEKIISLSLELGVWIAPSRRVNLDFSAAKSSTSKGMCVTRVQNYAAGIVMETRPV